MPTDVTLKWNGNPIVTFNYGFAAGISKDFTRSDDGTVLTEKHTITIKGAFAASGADANARYISLLNQTFSNASKVTSAGSRQFNLQVGKLEITGTELIYDSATLIGISVPEPAEDTAGIQFQEVNLTFESYNTPNYNGQSYKIKSATESFDFKKDEDKIFYENSDITNDSNLKYGFTITHTISAQGLFDNKIASKSDALTQAYKYVKAKLKDNLPVISSDVLGGGFLGGQSFDSSKWLLSADGISPSYDVVSSEINSYNQYNKVRSSSADMTTATYSVTTTYFLTKEKATIDINANFNRDESGESSVSVEGTIQGVSTQNPNSVTHDKLANARDVYNILSNNGLLKSGCSIFTLANTTFNNYHPDKTYVGIRDYPMATTVGENKTTGTISFNVTYRIYATEFKAILDGITGAIAANISINDVNRYGAGNDMQTIVVIPIVGRAKGPILQDMSTTKERKRSAVIDVIVDASQRTANNDALKTNIISKVNAYKPAGAKVEGFNESWNWTTGKYTATLDWIYQP